MSAVDAATAPANREAAASHSPVAIGPPASVPFLRHPTPTALLSLACAAAVFARHPVGAGAVLAGFMAAVLVVVAATDIERRIIPNRVVLPATALMLLGHVAMAPQSSLQYLLAGLCAAAVFVVPNLIGLSWMGMGDVKLILLLGVGLGSGVLGALTIAFLSMFPFALASLLRGGVAARRATLPFGPFLALGGLIMLVVPHLAI
jgi:prepilin signal peptidase PulO-like enzyme (type II secretory pathway)